MSEDREAAPPISSSGTKPTKPDATPATKIEERKNAVHKTAPKPKRQHTEDEKQPRARFRREHADGQKHPKRTSSGHGRGQKQGEVSQRRHSADRSHSAGKGRARDHPSPSRPPSQSGHGNHQQTSGRGSKGRQAWMPDGSTQGQIPPSGPNVGGEHGRDAPNKSGPSNDRGKVWRPMPPWKMKELLASSPNEIILSILSPRSGFLQCMEMPQIRQEVLELMVQLLAEAAVAEHVPQSTIILLRTFSDSSFASGPLTSYLVRQCVDPAPNELPLTNLAAILQKLLRHLPSSSLKVVNMLTAQLQTIVTRHKAKASFKELAQQMEEIQMTCVDVTRQIHGGEVVRDQDQDEADVSRPPEDYRKLSVAPTARDISTDEPPFLRKNKVFGVYRDADHYLDVQFRLFREDFIGPLRQGIRELAHTRGRQQKYNQDIRVYTGVDILEPHCTRDGIVRTVKFDVSHLKRVQWDTSKRLIYGSLVCLSRDRFKTIVFGTVAEREASKLTKGIIQIAFEELGLQILSSNPCDGYEMVESSAYFEAYRHTLQGLQEVEKDDLPFFKYLLNPKVEISPPRFLQIGTGEYDFTCMLPKRQVIEDQPEEDLQKNEAPAVSRLVMFKRRLERIRQERKCHARSLQVPLLDLQSWPTAEELHLDESQYRALQSAMTKEFVLIQGPPGTGKTFIGLKIVDLLLRNEKVWNNIEGVGSQPILVVCFTNHALDQFLEGILQFYDASGGRLIRIGGRCSSENEALCDCKLAVQRKTRRDADGRPQDIRDGMKNITSEMDVLVEQIEHESKRIELLRKGIIHERYLQQKMTEPQVVSMMSRSPTQVGSNSCMVAWLLGSILLSDNANEDDDGADQDGADSSDDERTTAIESNRMIEEHEDDHADQIKMVRKKLEDMDSVPELALSAPNISGKHKKKKQCTGDGWFTVRSNNMNKNILRCMTEGLDSKDPMTADEALKVYDVWTLAVKDRWRLYRFWSSQYCADSHTYLHFLYMRYTELAKWRKEHQDEEDFRLIREATVVGMTTTGAAKFRRILQRVQPKIVIVEEAAEVFEAHIVSTLSENCEQLILIGDHQQLRPNPTMYRLAKDYHLDVSLFERMVKNEMRCDRLGIQHRMRPEIAKLIVPHVYRNLQNAESVLHYEHVAGINGDLFLIEHDKMEANEEDTKSHSNTHEAEYLVALCRYLLQQGYQGTEVTVLTTYTGQMFAIRQEMRKKSLVGVRVTPVDNYQGEENEIILLSLVRSNEDGKIGFLKVENRVCVALSRAKKGFYAIGNMKQLAEGSVLWNRIVEDFRKENRVVEALPLACQNHPDTTTLVESAADFAKVSDGGCERPCEARLECGHACTQKCHPTDRDHIEYQCRKPCLRTVCDLRHGCPKKCSDECGPCQKQVEKEMPNCLHPQMMPCSQNVEDVPCAFIIPDREWPCGHMISVECQYNPENYKCHVKVQKTLPCGHMHEFRCSDSIEGYDCQETVEVGCEREHTSTVKCFRREGFKCQHTTKLTCQGGIHQYQVKCHNVENARCSMACQKKLPCGHLCSGTCGQCSTSGAHLPCQAPCSKHLTCNHLCQGRCSEPCQSCQSPCIVRCAHRMCGKMCGWKCDPCQLPCSWQCIHLQCTRPCSERCNRRTCNAWCPLRLVCGHDCPGLCGEPCPPQCRKCQTDVYKDLEKRLNMTFDKKSRFLALQPCGHTVEVGYMDELIEAQKPGKRPRPIQLYHCPICQTVITFCPRYGNAIKDALRELHAVKAPIFERHQSRMSVIAAFRKSTNRTDVAGEYALRLADRKWVEANTDLVQVAVGCCSLLSEMELLKVKTVNLRKMQKRREENQPFGSGRSYAEDEASPERIELILKSAWQKLGDCMGSSNLEGTKKLSESLKTIYLKTHMRVMMLFVDNSRKREQLYEYLHPSDSFARRRRFKIRGDRWREVEDVPDAECEENGTKGNESVKAKTELEKEEEPLAGGITHVANRLKLDFTDKQRNNVTDFLLQLHRFFNPDLGGFTHNSQETWLICIRGHVYQENTTGETGDTCPECQRRGDDDVDDGEWNERLPRARDDDRGNQHRAGPLRPEQRARGRGRWRGQHQGRWQGHARGYRADDWENWHAPAGGRGQRGRGTAPPGARGTAPPGARGTAPPGARGTAPPGARGTAPPGARGTTGTARGRGPSRGFHSYGGKGRGTNAGDFRGRGRGGYTLRGSRGRIHMTEPGFT